MPSSKTAAATTVNGETRTFRVVFRHARVQRATAAGERMRRHDDT
jgi:hypothetical protein